MSKNGKADRLKKVVSAIIYFSLIFVFCVSANAAYPSDTTLDEKFETPALDMPGYLQPFTDPTFGTQITRISDPDAWERPEGDLRHMYSKVQPWNSDGSLIIMGYPEYPAALLDGNTYELLRWIHLPWQGRWSNTDTNKAYGVSPMATGKFNSFVSWNMTTDEGTVIHTFSDYEQVSIGDGEGFLSNDDRYVALQCDGKNGEKSNAILVYDIAQDQIVSTLDIGEDWPNNVTMSPSGNYVLVQWNVEGTARSQGIEVFDRDLNFLRQLSTHYSHFDVNYDTEGDEVIVDYYTSTPDTNDPRWCMIRLADGERTDLFGDTEGRVSWNWHFSARNVDRPGWIYVSDFNGSGTDFLGEDEVYAVKLDGSGTVERFAKVHNTNSSINYSAQPQAVPNRDGTKVMFASNWGVEGGKAFAYVAGKVEPTGPSYTLSIGDENNGGAGKTRTIAIGGEQSEDLDGKNLAVQFTEGWGENAKVSVVMINPTSENITVSYQAAGTKVEAWLTDGMPDLTAEDMGSAGIDAYASTEIQ